MRGRVILDTGVWVSGLLLPRSVPRKAVLKALRTCQVLFSQETLSELDAVLKRSKFDRYVSLQRRRRFLDVVLDTADIVLVKHKVKACRDPKDDAFLSLADAGDANAIVSGDDDLLSMLDWNGIAIVSPAEFVRTPKSHG